MSTMMRLPFESSLPFPTVSNDSPASVISPLTLPRGGYFDLPTSTSRTHTKLATVYSPLSPNVRGPAVPQPPQFLSPHLTPITKEVQHQLQQHRSTSLPPSYRGASPSTAAIGRQDTVALSPVPRANVSNSPLPFSSGAPAGHPRSVSADAASAPSHVHMIRRLVQQNARIREAWEAERKYMEANRERAEEVYKEERALMEEERMEWEAEKTDLLREIKRLHQLVMSLGLDPRQLSPAHLRGGGGTEYSPESMRSSHSSQGSGRQGLPHPTVGWNGDVQQSNGPADQTRFPPSGDAVSPKEETQTNTDPVPVVDIQEIHPELEGIPIKMPTLQKPTFTDAPSAKSSKSSSRASSPPTDANKPRLFSRGSNEQTLEVLAAPVHDRLTMHAGHTPSHSLSQLPTISATTTASSSGESTPKMLQADGANSKGLAPIPEGDDTCQLDSEHHPAPILEAQEDRELKGPLMVRNMPAHDEIFFRRLSDKLEEVQKDTMAALPAVLKDCAISEAAEECKPEAVSRAVEESPAAQEAVPDKSEQGSPKSRSGEELDIPLKFKKSFNFGAPLGEFR
ncbi:hypothetical protein V8F33_001031 [Rhypophila sp. PSN 637]